jgi:hypothetical protein
MESYPGAAVERAMKIQEVILRAIAKKITWFQAAEIAGLSARHMRRLRWRYENLGYDGLLDRRRGLRSERRVPLAVVEEVLRLFREQYVRPERTAFSREADREARDRSELYVGQAGHAGSRPGSQGAQAGYSP